MEPVPVTGLAPNFSPIPRIAPPPFGVDIAGKAWRFADCSRVAELEFCWSSFAISDNL
jgi:hypothetical protein